MVNYHVTGFLHDGNVVFKFNNFWLISWLFEYLIGDWQYCLSMIFG